MSGELLRRLLFRCEHQFSWPRQAEDGQHYQVCVHCGTAYAYDWSRMRRVARVEITGSAVSRRQCSARTRWTPRSRRLRHQVPVLLRACGTVTWFEGTTENVSASGLLLRSPLDLALGTPIEFTLDMPREITGEVARVLCCGSVVRSSPMETGDNASAAMFKLACSISGYTFAGPREIDN